MSDDGDDSKSISGPQDPHVERIRPRPDEPPQPQMSLSGLLGDSDRPGHRRLYFTRSLDYYVEFKIEDVLATASIPSERAPFSGIEATEVTLKKDAVLSYTRTRRAHAPDEFDIDMRRMPRRRIRRRYMMDATNQIGTCGQDCFSEWTCQAATCNGETCATCDQNTCYGESCAQGLCDTAVTCFSNCMAITCQCTLEVECHSNFTDCASCDYPLAPGCNTIYHC
jgi:hypothetical protein